jgi:hypothetical protein
MQVFQQEYDDGVSEAVAKDNSVSFASVAEPLSVDIVYKKMKAFGSIKDQDMYYVQSILVSSTWNKNDDVFDPQEIWKAKESPTHKPTNLNHDENIIVGHIVSNYPITDEGILIDKDTPVENLPEKYHILTGAVIYKAYTNPDLKERTRDLIASIENGTKYVSMECYFNNFDYGLMDKETGELKVIARDNDSAYLTKYLRAYGGNGERDNYKIGRVLRNITYSGKGYVDKPANEDSIILKNKLENFDDLKKEESKNIVLKNKGVSEDNTETNTAEACIMSEQEKLDTLPEDNKTVEVAEACEATTVEATQVEADNAEAVMKKHNEEKAAMEKKLKDAKASIDQLQQEIAKSQETLAEMNKRYSEVKKENEAMMMQKKKEKRMASLVDCGFDDSEIEESLAAYDALDDDAFESVVAMMKKKMAKKEDMKDKEAEAAMPPALKEAIDKKKKKEEESKAEIEFDTAEEILEEVEETEALDLAVGGEDGEVHSTSAALVEFVYSRLGKKLNKGE